MENDLNTETKQKNIHLVKISRLGIIVFLKRNIIVLALLLIFLITTIVGVWNIHKYEIYNKEGTEIDPKVYTIIENYIKENVIGKNFFELNSTALNDQLYKDVSYIKSVKVEKSIPNKVTLFTELFSPKLVAYLKESKCLLLSDDGFLLEELCTGSDKKCCDEYSATNYLYLFSSSEVDISKLEDGKSRLLIMEDISKIVKSIEAFKYEVKNILLQENVLTIKTNHEKTFVFSFSSSIEVQLQRFLVVMGKIEGDNLKFKSLDLRFERPVMKN